MIGITDEFDIYCIIIQFIIKDTKWYILSYNIKGLFVKLSCILCDDRWYVIVLLKL